MHQIKIFKGLESDTASLESTINGWLKSNGAKVVHITGNIAPQTPSAGSSGAALGGGSVHSPSDVLVVVVYEVA